MAFCRAASLQPCSVLLLPQINPAWNTGHIGNKRCLGQQADLLSKKHNWSSTEAFKACQKRAIFSPHLIFKREFPLATRVSLYPIEPEEKGCFWVSSWYKQKWNQQKRALNLPPWAEWRDCNRVRQQKENIIRSADDKFKFDAMRKEEAWEKSTERRWWDNVLSLVAAERCKQRRGSWDKQEL